MPSFWHDQAPPEALGLRHLYSPDELTMSWMFDGLDPVCVAWKARPPLEGSTA